MATDNHLQTQAPTDLRNSAAHTILELAKHQIDPLQSPVLQQEFPGLTAAFDEQSMQAALQSTLWAPEHPRAIIERCEIEQATNVPGECVILRYTLVLRDGQSGLTREALISGRLFQNQLACAAYTHERLLPLVTEVIGRDELAWFDNPVGMIADLCMAIHAWPIDGELPSLIGATDIHRLVPILNEVLPAFQGQSFTVAGCHAELVDYGRQQRATLRYHVTGRLGTNAEPQELLVYGKLTGDGSGGRAGAVSHALRQRIAQAEPRGQFTVPRVLAWREELQLCLLEAIPGEASLGDVVKASVRGKPVAAHSLDEMIDACAWIAARLHTSDVSLGPRRTFADEIARLREYTRAAQRLNPDLGQLLQSYLDRLVAAADEVSPMQLAFCHGDFTEGQILFHGTGCGLIDFDSICQAEPALDLGQFLTYLELTGLKAQKGATTPPPLVRQVRERFFAAYAGAARLDESSMRQLRERVRLYQAISLLRRVLRSWQKFKPGRIEGALTMLEEVLA